MCSNFRAITTVLLAVSVVSMTACAGMSSQTRDTAVGAAVGGVAGSILTGGSPVGTVGGAVVGGVIGNEVNKKK